MKRVLNYGLPALNVAILMVLLVVVMKTGLHPATVPSVLDIGFPVVNFALLVALLLASRGWTGPSQQSQINELRDGHRVHSQRLDSAERNIRHLYDEWARSLDNLRREMHELTVAMARVGELANRTTILETHVMDDEQRVQSLRDFGCGYPECPRARTLEKPGAVVAPKTEEGKGGLT